MSFDSVIFISCFLPVLAILCGLVRPVKARNVLLLISGLVFFAFGSLTGLLLLAACAAVNYAFGLLLLRSGRGGRGIAAAAVILDLAFLASFKYLDFILSPFAAVFGSVPLRTGLAAPIGISFFTFKCISYVIDTYRDRRNGTRSFFELLLYISFFPQIMAGPITRFPDFRAQLPERCCTVGRAAKGLRRFIIGLGKKLVLAGAAAAVADGAFGADAALDARVAWLCAIAYMLQIYFDFSGYSDMAIGLGEMFGFSTPENFNYPYAADSITDFWRRWHISLSSWFRDYLYIPLGGNRKGQARAALNKFVVFVLCGLWHGAGWNFLLWGAWHGLFSAAEEALGVKRWRSDGLRRWLRRIYVLLVVCIGFVFFRAENLAEGWQVLKAMLGFVPVTAASTVKLHELLTALNIGLLIVAAVFTQPVRKAFDALDAKMPGRLLSYAACLLLLALCLTRLAAGGFSPFIYFQF